MLYEGHLALIQQHYFQSIFFVKFIEFKEISLKSSRNSSPFTIILFKGGKKMKKILIISLIVCFFTATGVPLSFADEYDPESAAHPLRFLGYVFYPIGYAFDQLLSRPAHFLVHQKGIKTLFGHEEDTHRFLEWSEQ